MASLYISQIVGQSHYEQINLNSDNYHKNEYYIKDNNNQYKLSIDDSFNRDEIYYRIKCDWSYDNLIYLDANIIGINDNTITINAAPNGSNNKPEYKSQIYYLSIQGHPGLPCELQDKDGIINSTYRIGRTGIIEFFLNNDTPIQSISINGTYIQPKDNDYYQYNDKCIIDIVYKLKNDVNDDEINSNQVTNNLNTDNNTNTNMTYTYSAIGIQTN